MRSLLLAAPLLIAVACSSPSTAAETPAPTVEPWIVTGRDISLGERTAIAVTFTAPDGLEGKWSASWPVDVGIRDNVWYECWKSAAIGTAIPDCMRTP